MLIAVTGKCNFQVSLFNLGIKRINFVVNFDIGGSSLANSRSSIIERKGRGAKNFFRVTSYIAKACRKVPILCDRNSSACLLAIFSRLLFLSSPLSEGQARANQAFVSFYVQ